MTEDNGVARRPHYQQHLVARPHTVVGAPRLTRELSVEGGASSSDDELLAGEMHFEAKVGILCRKKSSKSVHFEQDSSERVLQLQGDQLKLKKKDKLKSKIFLYYVWVRRNISDYVRKESHRLKDENLAILAGWYKDLMIVTFATVGDKELFLIEFQKINMETLRTLYGGVKDLSEQCLVAIGNCFSSSSAGAAMADIELTAQMVKVQPYETANDVVRRCKSAFKLDSSQGNILLRLDGSSGHCMIGCESIFGTVLYLIHQMHKARSSILSEASSNSPNESNSMDLDESLGRDATVRFSLHREACAGLVCATQKKKSRHQNQVRRASEVPTKIRHWFANDNRKSQLMRQGSAEALSVFSNGGGPSDSASPIIGRSLAELFPSGIVSRPVTCLLAQIYHRCYTARGIFRQPGSVTDKNQVLQLLNTYDMASEDNIEQLNHFGEHCIADALKHYIRLLPGCLLQASLANQWTRVVHDFVDDPDTASAEIRAIVRQMQPQNAHLLHMLMTTLKRVADNHDQNQMTSTNIGASVSFSVLDFDRLDSCLKATEQKAQVVNKLIDIMITNYSRIWPDETENLRVRGDFLRHICQQLPDEMSSMESLIGETARHPDSATEPLSLSSISKDSGLQLSDQQPDDNRRPIFVIDDVPQRSQPPPYDIAVKRQARSHTQRSKNSEQQPAQMAASKLPDASTAEPPITPRRELPPVPARLHKRPASLGPSNRRPMPTNAGSSNLETTTTQQQQQPLSGDSKARHPLSSIQHQQQPQSQSQQPQQQQQSQQLAPSSARPVRVSVGTVGPATAAAAAVAAATAAAAAEALQKQQLQLRFRKRSSSETRLDLIGLTPGHPSQPMPAPRLQRARDPEDQPGSPGTIQRSPGNAEATQRPRGLARFYPTPSTRGDSLDGVVNIAAFASPRNSFAAVTSSSTGSPFSNRHTPIRGSGVLGGSSDFSLLSSGRNSPRQPRPRTRLPEALQRKLADQPESLV